jgi:hypothetical protein
LRRCAGLVTLLGMAKKRQPIDELIDLWVWIRRQSKAKAAAKRKRTKRQ